MLANACGPCIGQWRRDRRRAEPAEHDRHLVQPQLPRPQRRQPTTMNFIASPEIVTALALAGRLSFNPLTDTLTAPTASRSGSRPRKAPEVPRDGFARGAEGYMAPPADGDSVTVEVPPTASGCSCWSPWPAWDGKDFVDCRCCSRPRARPPPTTSLRPAPGCASAATWTASATTCSWARSTPSPARPARASTC